MAEPSTGAQADSGFPVHLDNFDGPFDLLLSLIARQQLDITEVALARVTDDYINHVRMAGVAWDLERTSAFLVVAATLLDLKAARLLPRADVEDAEDLAALEARDLLFARLLQYRAYKRIAGMIVERLEGESRRYPRTVGPDERFAALLPEVILEVGIDELAAIAARALAPKPEPELAVAHLHVPAVSVRDQAITIVDRLRRSGTTTFRSLCSDSGSPLTTVARFLALLELYRDGVVSFDQAAPLGELTVRWTGPPEGEVSVSGEFDTEQHPDRGDTAQ